jgi:hypothetical protein
MRVPAINLIGALCTKEIWGSIPLSLNVLEFFSTESSALQAVEALKFFLTILFIYFWRGENLKRERKGEAVRLLDCILIVCYENHQSSILRRKDVQVYTSQNLPKCLFLDR